MSQLLSVQGVHYEPPILKDSQVEMSCYYEHT